MNYWDTLMGSEEGAGAYMDSYGEGIDTIVRQEIMKFVDGSVLDVGCGPGWNMETFQKVAKRYKGTDYAELFVKAANKRRKEKMIPTDYALPFELGDCRKINEPNNSWDIVLLQDVLEHTSGYEQCIAEALRVARKKVIVTFWHMIEDDLSEHVNIDGDDGFGYWYSRPRWERFLDWINVKWTPTQFEWPENRLRDIYVLEVA